MRSALVILIVCFASIALADDFKTIDGKEYKNVKVSRIEPDGIVITFSGGIVKIPFTELSPEIQKKYGYDAKAAADFQQQTYQGDVVRARQLAEATEKRRQELAAGSTAEPAAKPVQRQSIAESMHGSALDQRSGPKSVIWGKIYKVTDDGLILEVLYSVGAEQIQNYSYVLIKGSFPGYFDDDRIQVQGIPSGTYRGWRGRTVRAFDAASINKFQ